MSKFLKFIVHFVVICTILCVVALAAPPFFGVTTVIVDNAGEGSNLPMGSVTYAIPVKTEEVNAGTPILVQDESITYRYNIVSLNMENRTAAVVDPTVSASETIPVSVKNYVPKVVITIGYLGYLLVATESIEGLIVLGLAVLFLVILYVIAELLKKDPVENDYEEDDYPTENLKSKKELKREEKERAKRMKEEDRQMLRDEKQRKKAEKKNKKIIKTGGFVDEIYEEEPEEEEEPAVNVQAATSEAHALLKKEIAAATAEEPQPVRRTKKAVQTPPKAAPKVKRLEEEVEVEPVEIKKMAIPVWSAAQLADKAKKDGDAPDIVKDEITNVTLFDYSDIIGGEDDPSQN